MEMAINKRLMMDGNGDEQQQWTEMAIDGDGNGDEGADSNNDGRQ